MCHESNVELVCIRPNESDSLLILGRRLLDLEIPRNLAGQGGVQGMLPSFGLLETIVYEYIE